VERHNADGMLGFGFGGGGGGFFASSTSGHTGLLVGAPDGGLEEARAVGKRLAKNGGDVNKFSVISFTF
jgi:hypothetical protein